MLRSRIPSAVVLLCATLIHASVAAAAPPDPLPRARPEQVGMSAQRLANLTPVLKSYVDNQQVAGSVALVARRGKLVYFEAFGQADREARVPMQTDSIFRIASQTKAIVTAAAMMLVEQGKLGLNDPISRYIPEFANASVALRPALSSSLLGPTSARRRADAAVLRPWWLLSSRCRHSPLGRWCQGVERTLSNGGGRSIGLHSRSAVPGLGSSAALANNSPTFLQNC